jgi:hypothetical protein
MPLASCARFAAVPALSRAGVVPAGLPCAEFLGAIGFVAGRAAGVEGRVAGLDGRAAGVEGRVDGAE